MNEFKFLTNEDKRILMDGTEYDILELVDNLRKKLEDIRNGSCATCNHSVEFRGELSCQHPDTTVYETSRYFCCNQWEPK